MYAMYVSKPEWKVPNVCLSQPRVPYLTPCAPDMEKMLVTTVKVKTQSISKASSNWQSNFGTLTLARPTNK